MDAEQQVITCIAAWLSMVFNMRNHTLCILEASARVLLQCLCGNCLNFLLAHPIALCSSPAQAQAVSYAVQPSVFSWSMMNWALGAASLGKGGLQAQQQQKSAAGASVPFQCHGRVWTNIHPLEMCQNALLACHDTQQLWKRHRTTSNNSLQAFCTPH
jgi:hypothetical protein